jgi:hypothetical protein
MCLPLIAACWNGCIGVCEKNCPSKLCAKCGGANASNPSGHIHRFCPEHSKKYSVKKFNIRECLNNKCAYPDCGNKPVQLIVGHIGIAVCFHFCIDHRIQNIPNTTLAFSPGVRKTCMYCNAIARYTCAGGVIPFLCETHKDDSHIDTNPKKKKNPVKKRVKKVQVKLTKSDRLKNAIAKCIKDINACDEHIRRILNTNILGEPIVHSEAEVRSDNT